jgi:hypothetical protein
MRAEIVDSPSFDPENQVLRLGQPVARCIELKRKGGRCSSFALEDSPYCFTHDPNKTEARHQRNVNGWLSMALQKRVKDLTTYHGLANFTAVLIHRIMDGDIDEDVGKVVASLINVQRGNLDRLEPERRLEQLKNQIEEATGVPIETLVTTARRSREEKLLVGAYESRQGETGTEADVP